MKVCVKKLRCPNCQRMVRCRDQKNGDKVRIVCPSCNRVLYTWNGVSWQETPRST